jgi:hypothetical protein
MQPKYTRTPTLLWKFLWQLTDCYEFLHKTYTKVTKKKTDDYVFCFGYGRTGTKSLDAALSELGYASAHWFERGTASREDLCDKIRNSPYNAFSDDPMFQDDVYKLLDREFPDAKFILTVRNTVSWQKSVQNWFKGSPWEVKNQEDLEKRTQEHLTHVENVKKYFAKRPEKLLVFDVTKNGWKELRTFLEKDVPKRRFPKKNLSKHLPLLQRFYTR